MNPIRLLLVAVLIGCLLFTAPAAHAWRQPVLNLGLTNVLDGAAPPPGLYLNMYTVVGSAPSADLSENFPASLDPALGFPPGIKDADITIAAIAPQIVWVSPYKCPLTGGNFGFQFFPILGTKSVDDSDVGADLQVNNSPVGDLYLGPFLTFHHMLGGPWSLHWVAEFDAIAPIGNYDSSKNIQLASNHWTIEPWVSFTLLGPAGLELSSRLHYTYNFTNDEFTPNNLEMQPGQAFHLNYSLTKEVLSPKLRMGLVGYYLQQLTEDEIESVKIPDSEEMAFAVGPVIWYNKGDFIFEAKTHIDVAVENRPKAITGVLRVIYNFF
jgi:hypothetical protein